MISRSLCLQYCTVHMACCIERWTYCIMYIMRCRILCSVYLSLSIYSINPIPFSFTFTSSTSSSSSSTTPQPNQSTTHIVHSGPPTTPRQNQPHPSLPSLPSNPTPKKCASSTKSAAAAGTTATSKPDAPTTPEEVSHHVVEHMEFGIRVERLWRGLRIVVRADHRC